MKPICKRVDFTDETEEKCYIFEHIKGVCQGCGAYQFKKEYKKAEL